MELEVFLQGYLRLASKGLPCGEGLYFLKLVRNSRTSPEIIERFFARLLSVEINIDVLQSKQRRNGKESTGV